MALDISTVKAPPAKKASVKPKVTDTSRHTEHKNAIGETLGAASMILVMFGLKADAGAIAVYGESISQEVATVADDYDQVANAVDYLSRGSIWIGLITALAPLGMQIAGNHNLVPENMRKTAGLYSRETMVSIIDTQLAEREAQILKEQKASHDKLAALKAEINSYIDEESKE
jgi:hypothetical protein